MQLVISWGRRESYVTLANDFYEFAGKRAAAAMKVADIRAWSSDGDGGGEVDRWLDEIRSWLGLWRNSNNTVEYEMSSSSQVSSG